MEQERNNIVLIGMPSAGKSTLGIVLAKILNYQFVDADLVIQNQCDKTLQKLIDACGPEGFIQVENEILRDIEAENSIIATGGSAVYSDEAMKHLAEIGRVVYLQISYEELVSRLHDLQERGVVLKGGIGMSLRGIVFLPLLLKLPLSTSLLISDLIQITVQALQTFFKFLQMNMNLQIKLMTRSQLIKMLAVAAGRFLRPAEHLITAGQIQLLRCFSRLPSQLLQGFHDFLQFLIQSIPFFSHPFQYSSGV